jgi:hypothetical protein
VKPPTHCCTETRVSRIKVEQFGRKAVFINDQNTVHQSIQVDGCVIQNEKAADYVVSRAAFGDVIVELKGKDVEEAVKQVEATAKHWIANGYCTGKIAALIVSTQFPKANTSVRRAQERFAKAYKSPLHVVTKNYEGRMEAVFSFKGPHKE